MSEKPLRILAVVGSLQRASVTRVVIGYMAEEFTTAGCQVDTLDFLQEPLAL